MEVVLPFLFTWLGLVYMLNNAISGFRTHYRYQYLHKVPSFSTYLHVIKNENIQEYY
ncbi:hypothetical protein Pint_24857 [Pistacia integerrima]|uniref:Uncharacterized protein n=1 Tax=Pistacia integerrima TaxID=434235 RepID=A0ACC0YF89_9ROSI|nr:hypothetical protein Pint_24857 [Pistacia integerrima]